ncbi:CAAD domain-containing protein [Okeanomitos corallinicola TIOX110]|uniref:CAAD domain-containing protein n=1 Tax=Okeanomitos corallinicola TIOX110 TaxID=3133117 RepID=A0ABZ2UUD0_9CYAN
METQQPDSTPSVQPEDAFSLGAEKTGNLSKFSPTNTSNSQSQWQQTLKQVVSILDQLPTYLGSFIDNNKQAILSIVFILSALITVKILVAVLDAVNGVPLLAPIFEIIGIFYAIWFTIRYLLKSESRKELSLKVSAFKQQLLG